MTTVDHGLGVGLDFSNIDPVAVTGLGGLVRDHFAHGRLFATVGSHGGLLDIGYWGKQHLGAVHFFKGDAESAWVKLFRVCVRLDDKRYYLTLNNTKLLPFGYSSTCTVEDVVMEHQLLLLEDTLVQRVHVLANPQGRSLQFDMVHQEACTAVTRGNRTWEEMEFKPKRNALVVSCRDENPPPAPHKGPVDPTEDSLAQKGLLVKDPDGVDETTWIAVGCDAPLKVRRGYHRRSKYYIDSGPITGADVAYYVTFATSKKKMNERLEQLATSVHAECDKLVSDYETRLASRPKIDVGDPVLNSAFGQYPGILDSAKVPDRPGAVRATVSGYWVWGWDGMTPIEPFTLANHPNDSADSLRFFHETMRPDWGIPHAYTSNFGLSLKAPFACQCQFIASLYHYVATTGDLSVAREVYTSCTFLLDQCRKDEVRKTGLVEGHALWPDFPEAMGEDGDDISALNNSLLYQGLRAMEYISKAVGHAALAADYAAWAKRLRKNYIKYLFDEEHGYFISSCSSKTLKPRKHYCCQAVYWITPFAAELVGHAPKRISDFMDKNLRSDKCLLSLPHWDTAWMADGNQLGSSYPTADHSYINVHKLVGDDFALKAWLGDVDWFWRYHTAPEAFTPEAENEAMLGPDNPGCKQMQAVTCWYSAVYFGLAGMDFDHEGVTFTPWGDRPITISGLVLRGNMIDLRITGDGKHFSSIKLNGVALPLATRKIPWSMLSEGRAVIECVRSKKSPSHPVIVRAHGLSIASTETATGAVTARIEGSISGDVVVQARSEMGAEVDGEPLAVTYDPDTQSITIPFAGSKPMVIRVYSL